MFLISNQERRDIIRMLETLRETLPAGKSLRRANMVRVAGLLIQQLEKKQHLHNDLIKQLTNDYLQNGNNIRKQRKRRAEP